MGHPIHTLGTGPCKSHKGPLLRYGVQEPVQLPCANVAQFKIQEALVNTRERSECYRLL